MRIYSLDTDKKVDRVILYLTSDEAKELKNALKLIINNDDNEKHHHVHVSDADYQREITVCIYREDSLEGFDERSKRLILKDE